VTATSTRALLLAAALAGCDAAPFKSVDVDLAPAPNPPAPSGEAAGAPRKFHFSVAAVESPRDTYSAYAQLFERLGNRLGLEIEFVQRRTYREVNDLLAEGRLDAALVCTGGYLDLLERRPGSVELIAVPVAGGATTYESLVIVPAASRATRVADLAGKRIAFTDELSFSGRAYLLSHVRSLGHDPATFFGTVTYTQSHDRSIEAVARQLVDGAAVHSLVWSHTVANDPGMARRVRVIHRSPPFGMMPVVASTRLPPAERERLRRVLLDLSSDPEGAAALEVLRFDGFAAPTPGLFDSAAVVVGAAR
jgi:phosphonate transport system substrate-binding protein